MVECQGSSKVSNLAKLGCPFLHSKVFLNRRDFEFHVDSGKFYGIEISGEIALRGAP